MRHSMRSVRFAAASPLLLCATRSSAAAHAVGAVTRARVPTPRRGACSLRPVVADAHLTGGAADRRQDRHVVGKLFAPPAFEVFTGPELQLAGNEDMVEAPIR